MRKLILLFIANCCCLLCYAQHWTKKAEIPVGYTGAFSFVINDKVYVGGGHIPNSFYEFDPATNIWIRKADLPNSAAGRMHCIGFTIGNRGYYGLGADTTGTTFYTDLWVYDPAANTWAAKSPLPGIGREGAACFVANNKAYVVGGANISRVSEVWEYEPVGNSWMSKASYPGGPVIYATAFSLLDKGYVTTGFLGSDVSKNTYQFNPGSNTWSSQAPFLGEARQNAIAFVINNKVYCGLGRGYSLFQVFNDLYSYDPTTNTWSTNAPFSGISRWGATSGATVTKAYVGSGYDDLTDWWEFSPSGTAIASREVIKPIIFPNPVCDLLHVNVPDIFNNKFIISDIFGKIVFEGTMSGNKVIDVSQLCQGTFTLRIINDSRDQEFISLFYKTR